MKNIYLIVIISLLATACSSRLKRNCQKEDWYAYGLKLGQAGRDPQQDEFLKKCEAKGGSDFKKKHTDNYRKGHVRGLREYCLPEHFIHSGETGDEISVESCPEVTRNKLLEQLEIGQKRHCTKKGAYYRGLSGKDKAGFCAPEMKEIYDQNYQIGLEKYLKLSHSEKVLFLAKNKLRISEIEKDLNSFEVQLETSKKMDIAMKKEAQTMGKLFVSSHSNNTEALMKKIEVLRYERSLLQEDNQKTENEIEDIQDRLDKINAEKFGPQ